MRGRGCACCTGAAWADSGGHSSLPDALADAADYGYCASHSRRFYGFRLHAQFAPDGTPRALALTSPKVGERDVTLGMLARVQRPGQVVVIGDKGYAGKDFQANAAALDATIVRPRRKDQSGRDMHLAPIRQRIESIRWTARDILTSSDTAQGPCTPSEDAWSAA